MPSSNPARDEVAPTDPPSPAVEEDARRIARVISVQSEMFEVGARYVFNMRSLVFDTFTLDQKREHFRLFGARHRETMLSHEFFYALAIIWKESSFVSEAALNAAGAISPFQSGGLNSHSLGCCIARDKDNLHAATQRASAYAVIATAYGLIRQMPGKSRSIELCGTSLLHQLMLATVPGDPASGCNVPASGTASPDIA